MKGDRKPVTQSLCPGLSLFPLCINILRHGQEGGKGRDSNSMGRGPRLLLRQLPLSLTLTSAPILPYTRYVHLPGNPQKPLPEALLPPRENSEGREHNPEDQGRHQLSTCPLTYHPSQTLKQGRHQLSTRPLTRRPRQTLKQRYPPLPAALRSSCSPPTQL